MLFPRKCKTHYYTNNSNNNNNNTSLVNIIKRFKCHDDHDTFNNAVSNMYTCGFIKLCLNNGSFSAFHDMPTSEMRFLYKSLGRHH